MKNRNSSKAVMTIHKLRASMKVNRSFRSEAVKNTRMIRVKQRSRNIYCHRSFSPVNRSPVNMGTTEEEGSNSCDSSTAGRTSDCGSMGTSRVENCDSSSDDDFDESYEQSATEQDTLIYDGAQITVNESVTAILSFFLRYDLSAACLSSTLDLISLHCKKENLLIKSLYKLKKYFQRIETPIKRHYFCSTCSATVELENSECPNCKVDIDAKSFFLESDLIAQLQQLLAKSSLYEKMQYPISRVKKNAENYEDVYDGEIYQKFIRENVFPGDKWLTFTWNSDGLPV